MEQKGPQQIQHITLEVPPPKGLKLIQACPSGRAKRAIARSQGSRRKTAQGHSPLGELPRSGPPWRSSSQRRRLRAERRNNAHGNDDEEVEGGAAHNCGGAQGGEVEIVLECLHDPTSLRFGSLRKAASVRSLRILCLLGWSLGGIRGALVRTPKLFINSKCTTKNMDDSFGL